MLKYDPPDGANVVDTERGWRLHNTIVPPIQEENVTHLTVEWREKYSLEIEVLRDHAFEAEAPMRYAISQEKMEKRYTAFCERCDKDTKPSFDELCDFVKEAARMFFVRWDGNPPIFNGAVS